MGREKGLEYKGNQRFTKDRLNRMEVGIQNQKNFNANTPFK